MREHRGGRWIAVGTCALLVGGATALIAFILFSEIERGSPLTYVPIVALVLYALSPFVAAWLSDTQATFVAGAGALVAGAAAMLIAAAVLEGAAAPVLVIGIGVGGILGLHWDTRVALAVRVLLIGLLTAYTIVSARLVAVAFVYPVLGLADALADGLAPRRQASSSPSRVIER